MDGWREGGREGGRERENSKFLTGCKNAHPKVNCSHPILEASCPYTKEREERPEVGTFLFFQYLPKVNDSLQLFIFITVFT